MTKKQYKKIIEMQSDVIDRLYTMVSKYMSVGDFCRTEAYQKMKEVVELRAKEWK